SGCTRSNGAGKRPSKSPLRMNMKGLWGAGTLSRGFSSQCRIISKTRPRKCLQLRCFFPNAPPRILHVPRLSVCLADAKPQRELAIQLRVRQKKVAALTQPVHDSLVRLIPGLVAEANQIQGYRRGQFEAV